MPAQIESTGNLHSEVHGKSNIPESGILVIPNQFAFRDLSHFEDLFAGRKIVYLIDHEMDYSSEFRKKLEAADAEAFEFSRDPSTTEAFKKQLRLSFEEKALVLFVPGKTQTRPGQTVAVPSSILTYLTSLEAPLLPLFVDHPAETCLSTEDPGKLARVVFSFGETLQSSTANLANFTENLLAASEVAYSSRPVLKSHLAFELLKGLKKHGSTTKVIDGNDESELPFDKLLGASIAFSKLVAKATDKKRVGVILPPGKAGLLSNLAVLFAGKIPVNLNFTAGTKAVESSIQQAGLDRFITAGPFIEKMKDFSWPEEERLILVDEVLPPIKKQIILWLFMSKILPATALAKMLGIPETGGREEAILLFTSGSSGTPKGVVLSHRNLLANVNQFGSRINLDPDDSALGCLPLFHSFGCTVTMWYPVIEGVNLVTYPSPLDAGKLAELIDKYSINLVLATPTFLRGYLRKASPEQLSSVKLVITGAEKLPSKVADAFEQKFGKPVFEGYGLTETAPVTNVNLPELGDGNQPSEKGDSSLPNYRPGSVGLFIPGIAVKITDPESGADLPLHSSGMIWLRGPNVFESYLDQPEKTSEVKKGEWFMTGDIGRLDEDGFLYIEGRLSRFSKIGGEMVPHETLENAINEAMGFKDDVRQIAVVGLPDEAKGEALHLLSSTAIDPAELRKKLLESGIPALWIPKRISEVEEIPILASGKLDIKACETIAGG